MRHVETSISVHASPEATLQAFARVDAMRQWWGADRGLIEPREGGVWSLAWERSAAGFKYVTTGRIDVLQPGRRLGINNLVYFNPDRTVLGPMALTVTVVPTEIGCDLTIRQEGYQDGPEWDWYYDSVRAAWPEVAKLVKQYAEVQG